MRSSTWFVAFGQGILMGTDAGCLLFMIIYSWCAGKDLDDTPVKVINTGVSIWEYKTVVESLDRCNERLRESEEYANENDYVIQQNAIVERFQPDTTEAENIQLCNQCSANCEEALSWCYYWREEACICFEEWEE
jgi:hypothetical protein